MMEYEYIKDAFTKAEDKTNLEVNNLNVDCITSKNQKFELDQDGNLTVKNIIAETKEVDQFTVNHLNVNAINSDSDKFQIDQDGNLTTNSLVGGEVSVTNTLTVGAIASKDNKFSLDSEGNLTVKSITAESGLPSGGDVDVLNVVYPVGSIYLSVNATNPTTLFGGTWEAFASGRTLVGVDLEDMDFNESNKVGGEKAHILTIAEMPSHNHTQQYNGFNSSKVWGVAPQQGDGTQMSGQTTLSTGGNLAHNNMPPYFTVYMWKRIA